MVDTGKKWAWQYVSYTVLFLAVNMVNGKKYEMSEIEIHPIPSGEPARIFTQEEMKEYDGSDPKKPILLGVRGVVFDVTEGKDFYGKGASYNLLAGKDASFAIAKWSLEPKDMHHDLSSLSDDDLKGLDEVFLGTYKKKYPVMGYMDYLMEKHANKLRERFRPEL
ncbi:hypothetical protein FSP39_025447 [Pinctada imbricata]|uniref:Cytochrome b5 heme-binding domain-containing protein n=1 Tax=Pinctada imbricata TaxID=66713 RepID=A0AA88Y1N3_PINIB|nr:hypothetical protein FSP39_025447 [Pinctada imbricata]